MNRDRPTVSEEQWTSWLADGDDILVGGGMLDALETANIPVEVRSELKKDLEFADRVRRALRRDSGSVTTAFGGRPGGDAARRPAPWAPLEGRRRLGRFELLELLGSGGFGTVYKARDPALERIVAIKAPRTGRLDGAESLERFFREARSVAQLRHPGIVPIHEVGQDEGTPYLVSEFIEGTTLAEMPAARRPTPRDAAQILAATADALQYAHEHGVIHRDVKPSNILMDRAGQPHLTDFGLARRDGGDVTLTWEGQVMGTPAYMSPEQASGQAHAVDGRADVYSLGAVLYVLLTGELPFRGNTRVILHQVMHQEAPSPRTLNQQVGRDLETICLKALAKEPARRYQTAGEMADDLRRFLAGRPIAARPVGPMERWRRWRRRNPLAAVLLTAVVLSLTAGTVISIYFALDARQQAQRADDKARDAANAERDAREAEKRKDEQLTRAEWLLYAGHLAAAHREWELGKTDAAWHHLNTCRADFRGWEHRLLATLFTRNQRTLPGHKLISGVALSGDGKRILSYGGGMVQMWDGDSGRELFSLKDVGWLGRVVFSPDGKRFAACVKKAVKIWDAADGRELAAFTGHGTSAQLLAFAPDGQRVVSADSAGVMKVWGAAGGQELLSIKANPGSAAFSSDGQRLITSHGDEEIKVWDATKGVELQAVKSKVAYLPADVSTSGDGRRSVSADIDGLVRLWHTAKPQPMPALGLALGEAQNVLVFKPHPGALTGQAIAADGQSFVTGGDQVVKVWDAFRGRELATLRGHTSFVSCVAISADGRRIVSGSQDRTVKVWDPAKDQQALKIDALVSGVTALAFSADSKRIAGGGQSDVLRIWDADNGRQLDTRASTLATITDAINGKDAWWLKAPSNSFDGATLSPDGKRVASLSTSNSVKVWDTGSVGELFSFRGHSQLVKCLAFSPDSKRVVSGGFDNKALVWDADTGRALLPPLMHAKPIGGVAFSADGKLLASASQDNTVKVWDAGTGQELLCLKGHSGWVNCALFSSDGRRIFTASNDHTVKVWNAENGLEILTLHGHAGGVNVLALSPDGRRLASGGHHDDTVRIWEADDAPQNPLRTQ